MKLFICWSGRRGKDIADVLSGWLEYLIGTALEPVMSMNIPKGALWFEEVNKSLDDCGAGLICLTPEALHSPWVHFEAGALSRTFSKIASKDLGFPEERRRIFPFLIGVDTSQLNGPLEAYQSAAADHCEDTLRLIESIVSLMPQGEEPKEGWKHQYDCLWKQLQKQLAAIEPASIQDVFPQLESMFSRKTFDEPAQHCLDQAWRERYDTARETLAKLQAKQLSVQKGCRRYIADIFDALAHEVDAYAMIISKLLNAEKFPIGTDGLVQIDPPGLVVACEGRRKKIKSLLAKLLDVQDWSPWFDEAFRFEEAETPEQRNSLIHRKTAEIRHADKPQVVMGRKDGLEQWPYSDWNFDRIMFYVHRENYPDGWSLAAAVKCVMVEIERIDMKGEGASGMALYHSLGPLREVMRKPYNWEEGEEVQSLLNEVEKCIEHTNGDAGGKLGHKISEFKTFLHKAVAKNSRPEGVGGNA